MIFKFFSYFWSTFTHLSTFFFFRIFDQCSAIAHFLAFFHDFGWILCSFYPFLWNFHSIIVLSADFYPFFNIFSQFLIRFLHFLPNFIKNVRSIFDNYQRFFSHILRQYFSSIFFAILASFYYFYAIFVDFQKFFFT